MRLFGGSQAKHVITGPWSSKNSYFRSFVPFCRWLYIKASLVCSRSHSKGLVERLKRPMSRWVPHQYLLKVMALCSELRHTVRDTCTVERLKVHDLTRVLTHRKLPVTESCRYLNQNKYKREPSLMGRKIPNLYGITNAQWFIFPTFFFWTITRRIIDYWKVQNALLKLYR